MTRHLILLLFTLMAIASCTKDSLSSDFEGTYIGTKTCREILSLPSLIGGEVVEQETIAIQIQAISNNSLKVRLGVEGEFFIYYTTTKYDEIIWCDTGDAEFSISEGKLYYKYFRNSYIWEIEAFKL